MKRIVLAVVFIIAFFPFSSVNSQAGHSIEYSACAHPNGIGEVTATAVILDAPSRVVEYQVCEGLSCPGWTSVGAVTNGWSITHIGLVGPSTVHTRFDGGYPVYTYGYWPSGLPACPESPKAHEPIIPMWLLTKPDSYCILISEYHPSVESQKRLCFPAQDWVADKAPCNGWVYDNDVWDCDIYGYSRLPFASLLKIYERHLAVLKELNQ